MAGLDIASGQLSDHGDTVQPSAAGPGVVPVTPIASGDMVQGGVFDGVAGFASQASQGEADASAAMSAGMSADADRRGRYEATLLPAGASYGVLVQFPPGPLDPGAGVGNTAPTGGFYDPPREYGGAVSHRSRPAADADRLRYERACAEIGQPADGLRFR